MSSGIERRKLGYEMSHRETGECRLARILVTLVFEMNEKYELRIVRRCYAYHNTSSIYLYLVHPREGFPVVASSNKLGLHCIDCRSTQDGGGYTEVLFDTKTGPSRSKTLK